MGRVKKRIKIMVFGTFDGLHPGHLNFFAQAKKLAAKSFLIVSVARDKNVKLIKKRAPNLSERKRAALVKKMKVAARVVLGGQGDHVPHIVRERPDVIALGYDQREYVKNLKKILAARGLKVKIVRLKAYKPRVYKNSLLKKAGEI